MNITVLGLAPTCMRQHSPSSVSDQILGGRSHKNFNPNCVGSDRIFDIQILTTANNSSILHLNTNHLDSRTEIVLFYYWFGLDIEKEKGFGSSLGESLLHNIKI